MVVDDRKIIHGISRVNGMLYWLSVDMNNASTLIDLRRRMMIDASKGEFKQEQQNHTEQAVSQLGTRRVLLLLLFLLLVPLLVNTPQDLATWTLFNGSLDNDATAKSLGVKDLLVDPFPDLFAERFRLRLVLDVDARIGAGNDVGPRILCCFGLGIDTHNGGIGYLWMAQKHCLELGRGHLEALVLDQFLAHSPLPFLSAHVTRL